MHDGKEASGFETSKKKKKKKVVEGQMAGKQQFRLRTDSSSPWCDEEPCTCTSPAPMGVRCS